MRMGIEDRIITWLAEQEAEVYLVGGWVRDRLLGRPNYDLDLAVSGDGLHLARRLANAFDGAYYPLDEERCTGRAIMDDEQGRRLMVDVARFRGPGLAADLADRDFTINALAIDVRTPEEIIDHHGGRADLEAGLIRPVSDAILSNDPIRALRAVRQAAQLGFRLAPKTEALIRRDGAGLARISGERVRDEFTRLLALPQSAARLEQLDDLGLLAVILPELEPLRGVSQPPPHHLPVLAHSLATVRALEAVLPDLPGPLLPFSTRIADHLGRVISDTRPRLISLKLAALLHDAGKAGARSVDDEGRIRFIGHDRDGAAIVGEALRRLRLSRDEVHLGQTIVRHHMRPLLLAGQAQVSHRAVYRFFRDTGEAGIEVLLHALADERAIFRPDAEDERWPRLVALAARMMGDYWERGRERVAPRSLVDGRDLMEAFELQPGPHVGELLEVVREAQVSGEIETREEALELVRRVLGEQDAGRSRGALR